MHTHLTYLYRQNSAAQLKNRRLCSNQETINVSFSFMPLSLQSPWQRLFPQISDCYISQFGIAASTFPHFVCKLLQVIAQKIKLNLYWKNNCSQ